MTEASRKTPLNVVFICIGNSCRSQMAEAFAKKIGGSHIHAWSAGSSPLGEIVSPTHDVLREKGISLKGHWSKGLKNIPMDKMDVVVGMGCEVFCPLPVGFKGRLIEWNIPDPYGHDLEYFRRVRDLIERQVTALLSDFELHRQAASTEPPSPAEYSEDRSGNAETRKSTESGRK